MILTVNIKLVFSTVTDRKWERIIEIPGDITLENLHDYLQCVLDFDNDHGYEFFVANSISGIKQKSYYYDSDEVMGLTLERLLTDKGKKKLFYRYDLGCSWVFQIGKTRKGPFLPIRNKRYPKVIEKVGSKLKQYGSW